MKWEPKSGTQIRVLDKRTWKVVKEYKTDAVFAYHYVNTWEDDSGDLWIDLMTVQCDGSSRKDLASCYHMNAFQLDTLKTARFRCTN